MFRAFETRESGWKETTVIEGLDPFLWKVVIVIFVLITQAILWTWVGLQARKYIPWWPILPKQDQDTQGRPMATGAWSQASSSWSQSSSSWRQSETSWRQSSGSWQQDSSSSQNAPVLDWQTPNNDWQNTINDWQTPNDDWQKPPTPVQPTTESSQWISVEPKPVREIPEPVLVPELSSTPEEPPPATPETLSSPRQITAAQASTSHTAGSDQKHTSGHGQEAEQSVGNLHQTSQPSHSEDAEQTEPHATTTQANTEEEEHKEKPVSEKS